MLNLENLNPFPIRSCLNCGSWLNLRTFFCLECHQQCLDQFRNDDQFLLHDFKLRSLFRWPPGESDVLSNLVLQMKNEKQRAWSVWAEEFLMMKQESFCPKETILVTSESSSGKLHAQNWAQAIGYLTGYNHLDILKLRKGHVSQKRLSRGERSEREFDADVEISNINDKRVIFVDDVVTTGQTALAAYKALNYPFDYEVWCLIYREL